VTTENETHTDAPATPDHPAADLASAVVDAVSSAVSDAFNAGAVTATGAYDEARRLQNRLMPVVFSTGPIPVTLGQNGPELRTDWTRKAAELGAAPPARRGTTVLHDIDSFTAHVRRHHRGPATTLWIDAKSDPLAVTAIYNGADEDGGTGWGDDRATISIEPSDEWTRWEERSGETMSQAAFAEWLEENLEEIAPPEEGSDHAKPIELLAMVRDLQIHTKGEFKRKVDPRTGTGTLVYSTEHGEGSTKIPRAFGIAIRPWDGADAYRVEARLSFSLQGSQALFTFKLHRLDEVWMKAVAGLAADLDEATTRTENVGDEVRLRGFPIFLGTPPEVVKVR
jgi:uncharacterized protein YfdQ (DUF2303 family)